MRKVLLLTISILLSGLISHAQAPKIKFGKVSQEELLMKEYERDTAADAVILYDSGNLRFTYNNYESPKRFEFIFKRHLRIKIFNKDALNYGNHDIYLYHSGSRGEKLTEFKAYSYNIENGKITKDKLGKKGLLIEEFDKNRDIAKCVLPNVKEGTVIELEYTITSDYLYYLREWQFQYTIPTVWTEFNAIIPEFYKYKHYFKGYNKLTINDYKSIKSEKFQILYEDNSNTVGRNASANLNTGASFEKTTKRITWNLDSESKRYHFAAANIPAFRNESFMPSKENYLFKLLFELSTVKMPRSSIRSYAQTWESVNEEIMDDDKVGKLLTSNKAIKKLLSEIINETDDKNTKMNKIYKYVQNTYKWNGNNKYYATSEKISEVIEEKSGSSGDLNLLLVALFGEAGLNAYPVLLSTRSNGMIVPAYPGENAFNYVIAYILDGTDTYLFDATDKFCTPNMPPVRCLNGNARICGEKFTDWIDIKANEISRKQIVGDFTITEDGSLEGKLATTRNNYFAYSTRKAIDEYEDLEEYMDEYGNRNHNIEVDDYTFKGIDSLVSPLEMVLDVEILDATNQASDLIYFNPLNVYTREDNPFKSEERVYPVNFNYPSLETYEMNYTIPDGYEISEIPKNLKFELDDKSASFSYKIVQDENSIKVTLSKKIARTIYNTNEYLQLRDLFNQMISKQSEQIVLKRKI